jgi:methylenetetrahydrofolate--tRNA-(uracil-5-)-methyltransferase
VPAGGALAVDREGFAAGVTARAGGHPADRDRAARSRRPAAGGLGQRHRRHRPPHLAGAGEAILQLTGEAALAFFDAIAPIVHRTEHRHDVAWFQSRYDKEGPGGDAAPTTSTARWTRSSTTPSSRPAGRREDRVQGVGERALFRRLPADRGDGRARPRDAALRADEAGGPDQSAHRHVKAYAVVQLRQDNALGTLYNMVGFQTKLKHGEQVRIFRTIPGLEKAEFARLGGLHRNTFINSAAPARRGRCG